MRRTLRYLVLLVFLLATCLVAAPAQAQTLAAAPPETQTPPGPCWAGDLNDRIAKWMYCVPPAWNGELVVFAHGYHEPGPDLDFQNLTLQRDWQQAQSKTLVPSGK